MSRRGTLIFLRPPVFLPAYVSVRLCFFQSMFPSSCTLASLYPVSLHPQHCSAPSLISPIFIHLSGSVCSSRLSCSFLFSLILSFHSSSSSFSLSLSLYFFFFSDIFSSYSPDSSCSSRDTPFWAENPVSRTDFRILGSFPFRDTPFSVKTPVSRAYSAKLWRTPCSDTPFWAENPVSRKGRAMLSVKWALLRMMTIIWWHSSVKWSFLRMVCFVRSVIFRCHLVMCQELTILWCIGTTNRHYCPFPGGWCAIKCCFLGTSHPDLGDMTSGSLPHLMNM